MTCSINDHWGLVDPGDVQPLPGAPLEEVRKISPPTHPQTLVDPGDVQPLLVPTANGTFAYNASAPVAPWPPF